MKVDISKNAPRVLCVAQLEDRTLADEQVRKQTRQPDRTIFYIDPTPAIGIENRRYRIAENHQKLREFVQAYKPDLVWQIEGDCVLEDDTLEHLLDLYEEYPAIYSGVQVGRHGLYCLGAWHVSHDRNMFRSVDHNQYGIIEVDAMGMYCFLMPAQAYLDASCWWEGERWGPDVNFFLSSPLEKFVDMDLQVGHAHNGGVIMPNDISTCNAEFWRDGDEWRFKQL